MAGAAAVSIYAVWLSRSLLAAAFVLACSLISLIYQNFALIWATLVTWAEWIWSEHEGKASAHQIFTRLYYTPAGNTAFWNPPPGDPGTPVHLFDGTIYERGGMTLQALREKVGDPAFFKIMRDGAQQNRFGTVTTPELIALAERDSGMALGAFFQVWLYQPGKPTTW